MKRIQTKKVRASESTDACVADYSPRAYRLHSQVQWQMPGYIDFFTIFF